MRSNQANKMRYICQNKDLVRINVRQNFGKKLFI